MRHVGVQDVAERFEPADLEAWAAWLADHHADTPGVWLVTPKASSGLRTFDYEAGILEALRFGWVDSTQRTVDDVRTMMWYAPRRPAACGPATTSSASPSSSARVGWRPPARRRSRRRRPAGCGP